MDNQARPCGDCTLCCKVLGIKFPDGAESAPGRWCGHCKPARGCSYYEHRPQVCRDFVCLWAQRDTLPDELNPSRCKVVMSALRIGRRDVIALHVDPGTPDAWIDNDHVSQFVTAMTAHGLPVVVGRNGRSVWANAPAREVVRKQESQHNEID